MYIVPIETELYKPTLTSIYVWTMSVIVFKTLFNMNHFLEGNPNEEIHLSMLGITINVNIST